MSQAIMVKIHKITDMARLQRAAEAVGAKIGRETSHKLYDRTVDGVGVFFPNWSFPAVFNLETGTFAYDTYNDRWGNTADLDKLLQQYFIAQTEQLVGHDAMTVVTEEDGTVVLSIETGA